jgi:guanylate kinase
MTTVFIISAPSGSGKTTLVSRLLSGVPGLMFSVSYTTRDPRGDDAGGKSYHFVSRPEFEAMIARDEFLEWAEVFGNYYGTHRGILEEAQAQGKDLVLDIDVQGARQLRSQFPRLFPSSSWLPRERFWSRGFARAAKIPEDVIKDGCGTRPWRFGITTGTITFVINRDLDESDAILGAIVRAERVRRTRIEEEIRPILDTFQA